VLLAYIELQLKEILQHIFKQLITAQFRKDFIILSRQKQCYAIKTTITIIVIMMEKIERVCTHLKQIYFEKYLNGIVLAYYYD
jgi:hypothetical protein